MQEQNTPCVEESLPDDGGAERRSFERHPCSWTVSCYTVLQGDSSRWPGTICNVSSGGISLVACRPFTQGEIIAVELVRPIDGLRAKLYGRIQHAITEGGVWIAGCRFLKRLSEEELKCLAATTAVLVERIARGNE
ncbi:MAG TPA: PilZ domain-containing protein [Gemmataceae bacterium]|nr:PilZ domain-containing protein [Gemmataceae bacterium]